METGRMANTAPERSPKDRIAILGGGWAGLLVAFELKKARSDRQVVVFERSPRTEAGGLLRSAHRGGFTFDCGGPHILFSKFPETLAEVAELLAPNVVRLPRRNFVRFEGKFVAYPFENGIYELPEESRMRLGSGLLRAIERREADPDWRPKNFREWIYGFFGDSVGAEYLEPYNQKIWKRDLEQLGVDWVYTPGRVPTPGRHDVLEAIAGRPSVGYREQAEFLYPKSGGVQALYESALRRAEQAGVLVEFGTPVAALARTRTGWRVNKDSTFDAVVNTIPLPDLLKCTREFSGLSAQPLSFDYNRVLVVGVALREPTPDQTAVYVPSPDVPFHRYTWMSYLNPVGPDRSNLIAEVTIPPDSSIDVPTIVRDVRRGLVHLKVVNDDSEILFTEAWLNEYGYPIYTHSHKATTARVLSALREKGVWSVGRWGSWEYWNTDMVLRAVHRTVDDFETPESGSAAA
jgi:protoporphyrinogen oxidase